MHYMQTQVFLERIKIPIVVKQKKAALDTVVAVNAPPPKGGGFGLRLKSAISAKADVPLLKQT